MLHIGNAQITIPGSVLVKPNSHKAISASGNARISGLNGTIYAPKAQVSVSGSEEIDAGITASKIRIDGNGFSSLLKDSEDGGESEGTVHSEGQLVMNDLWVAISDPDSRLSASSYERVDSANDHLNEIFGSHGVNLVLAEGQDMELADLTVLVDETSPWGAFEDGVLGCTDIDGRITLISGWDWCEGASETGITTSQYDFETIVMYELGHAIGLEHSLDTLSVMHSTLATGETKRSITTDDLTHLGDHDDGGSESLMAAPPRTNPAPETSWSGSVDLFLSTSPDVVLPDPAEIRSNSWATSPPADPSAQPLVGALTSTSRKQTDSNSDQPTYSRKDQLDSLDAYFKELAEFIDGSLR